MSRCYGLSVIRCFKFMKTLHVRLLEPLIRPAGLGTRGSNLEKRIEKELNSSLLTCCQHFVAPGYPTLQRATQGSERQIEAQAALHPHFHLALQPSLHTNQHPSAQP